ncbi:MAG: hypothetical protein N3F07_03945 [Candidatus Micrarchaeota archaeon]|nr:hypothetical protein [Candidatus Micrarchaeota archaeon]
MVLLLAATARGAQEVEEASQHNRMIAESLLGASNACRQEARLPTADDPFEIADLRVVAIIPSVQNITSDLESPAVLWSWSAKIPQSASFQLSSQGGCLPGAYEIYLPSSVELKDASISYFYAGKRLELPVSSQNPVPLGLPVLNGNSSKEGLYEKLEVNASGKLSVRYQYRKMEYRQECSSQGGMEVCGCKQHVEFGSRQYSKQLHDRKAFWVQTGNNSILWISPPLKKRMAGSQKAEIGLFARRLPASISFHANGNLVAEAGLYQFRLSEGMCGEKIVLCQYSPKGTVAVSKSESEMDVAPLVLDNLEYLPFGLEFGWESAPGLSRTVVVVEDWFGKRQEFPRDFSVREPSRFEPEGELMAIRQGSDTESPAAAAGRQKAELKQESSIAWLAFLAAAALAIPLIGRKAQ